MTQKEKELSEKYLGFKEAEDIARKNGIQVLRELSALAPHKVGEIIKWTEEKRKLVSGTIWRPVYEKLPPIEKKAVLTVVKASVHKWLDNNVSIRYEYQFSLIKKDGSVNQNGCHPNNYEWTGEVHDDYKEMNSKRD